MIKEIISSDLFYNGMVLFSGFFIGWGLASFIGDMVLAAHAFFIFVIGLFAMFFFVVLPEILMLAIKIKESGKDDNEDEEPGETEES